MKDFIAGNKLPSPFVVGETYLDRDGEYTVISVAGNKLTGERADGRIFEGDVELKARINRNVVAEQKRLRDTSSRGRGRRSGTTIERDRMITVILRFEADREDHVGVQIDQHLREAARHLGYAEEDLTEVLPGSNRSVFGNHGDWAKSVMTDNKLHEVVRIDSYSDGSGKRLQCNVYRITEAGS